MDPGSIVRGRVAWTAAGVLALAGGVAYLVIGGALWWWLGLAAVMPLVLLMAARLKGADNAPYSGGTDGPWGAP